MHSVQGSFEVWDAVCAMRSLEIRTAQHPALGSGSRERMSEGEEPGRRIDE